MHVNPSKNEYRRFGFNGNAIGAQRLQRMNRYATQRRRQSAHLHDQLNALLPALRSRPFSLGYEPWRKFWATTIHKHSLTNT